MNKITTFKDLKKYNDVLFSSSDNILFLTKAGSYLYGTNKENSDIDIRGVFLSNKSSWIGLETVEQHIFSSDILDCCIFEVKKFLKLCYNSNPNVIELLYVTKDNPNVLIWSDQWEYIRSLLIKNVISQSAKNSFIGFATSQIKKLIIKHGNKTGRTDLVKEHGFDVKFASHSIRLLFELEELLQCNNITLPLNDVVRKKCLDIKNGVFYKDIEEYISDFKEKKNQVDNIGGTLRRTPDYKKYKELFLEIFNKWIKD